MDTISDSYLIDCPRCGRLSCECTQYELYCPHCQYYLAQTAAGEDGLGWLSSFSWESQSEDFFNSYINLGEFIEYVPSDPCNWSFGLSEEGNLKMNHIHSKEESKPVTVFDVMIAEESKNGRTYWHNVGVAFPLTNGSNGLSLKLHMFPGLRLFVKESIRPVGAQKQNAEEAPF